MTDVLVSVRIPQSLLLELEKRVESEHFIDLSEQVRSIVRAKWLELSRPEVAELKQVRQALEQDLKEVAVQRIRQEVASELKKIQEQVRGDLRDR